MAGLRELLRSYVDDGTVPGAVGLVGRRDGEAEVAVVGSVDTAGTAPMARDSIFRVASLTKPIIAAATMILVDDGTLALTDPIARWLPELAQPRVVRTPDGPAEDTVPARRPITVVDLLTFTAGYGFPADFSLPAVELLFRDTEVGLDLQRAPAPDEWLATLSGVPMLYQPGTAWLYNTCANILSVLVARASGQPLPEFLASRLFEPLGMVDTGFAVPEAELHRMTTAYQGNGSQVLDPPDGQWATMPAFPSGAGGLAATVDDWYAFGRMLLDHGAGVLSPESVGLMTTDHLTAEQRAASVVFLEGQGWGFGGSVDRETTADGRVPGRYGWVGGTGTTGHVTPSTGTVAVLLTQVAMTSATPPPMMRAFWRYAASAG